MRIALALLATSCWTGSPSTVEPTARAPRATMGSGPALASELADMLRSPDDSLFLQQFIDRQIVLLDLDTDTVTVVCDAQTLSAVVRFGELLNDPDRPPVSCGVGPDRAFWCTQSTGSTLLWLDFVRNDVSNDESWQLVGGILPGDPRRTRRDRRMLNEYRAKLGVQACPP